MAQARTFTEENRARLVELHSQGKSCRDIAAEMGFSPATISKHAKALGLEFDRAQTDLATRAHMIDLRASRYLLAQKMLTVGHELLDGVDSPYLVYNFGGKSNTYREHLLKRPPVDAQRSMVTTAAIAFDKASKLIDGTTEGSTEADSVLDRLDEQLEAEFAGVEEPE